MKAKPDYALVDATILAGIRDGSATTADALERAVGAALHRAHKDWPFNSRLDAEFRVIDRRLQHLRRGGTIQFNREKRIWEPS